MELKIQNEWLSSALAHRININTLTLKKVVTGLRKKKRRKEREELEEKKDELLQERGGLWQEFENQNPPIAYYSRERIFPLSSYETESVDKWPFILGSFLILKLSLEQTKAWEYLYTLHTEGRDLDSPGKLLVYVCLCSFAHCNFIS